MPGRQEYNAALAPATRNDQSVATCGGRPVENLLGGDLQSQTTLDTHCYDRCERGPEANHGIAVRDGFEDDVALRGIARRGKATRRSGAPSRVSGPIAILRGRGLTDVPPARQSPEGETEMGGWDRSVSLLYSQRGAGEEQGAS